MRSKLIIQLLPILLVGTALTGCITQQIPLVYQAVDFVPSDVLISHQTEIDHAQNYRYEPLVLSSSKAGISKTSTNLTRSKANEEINQENEKQ